MCSKYSRYLKIPEYCKMPHPYNTTDNPVRVTPSPRMVVGSQT